MTLDDPIQDIGTIGILVLGVLTYLGNRGVNKGNQKLDEQTSTIMANAEKLDTATNKLDDVHDLVNSQLSDVIELKDQAESKTLEAQARTDVAEARTAVLEDEAKGS